MSDSLTIRKKYRQLYNFFTMLDGGVAVACSGGVDSSLLLCMAAQWCNGPVFALIADSVFVHAEDMESAYDNARNIGLEPVKVAWNPFSYPEIVRNDAERCYYCKFFMYKKLLAICSELNVSILMDGTHTDDIKAERPGLKAVRKLGIITPFSDFLLDKQNIRHLSLLKSLKIWNRPSQSCLATRIETGPLFQDRLALVARVESVISSAGVKNCRFKINNHMGIIMVPYMKIPEFQTILKNIKKVAWASGLKSIKIIYRSR